MGLSNELSCEARSFSRCRLNPHRCFQSEALRLDLAVLEPWVSPSVLLPSCSSQFICMQMWDCPVCKPLPHWVCQLLPCHPVPQSAASLGHPATGLPQVLSAWLPVSAPLICLDECFFFNFLVVGLPYSSIFCHFWLFFVFQLLLSFLWLCEEAQCVYLYLHLGRKSPRGYLILMQNFLTFSPPLTLIT